MADKETHWEQIDCSNVCFCYDKNAPHVKPYRCDCNDAQRGVMINNKIEPICEPSKKINQQSDMDELMSLVPTL